MDNKGQIQELFISGGEYIDAFQILYDNAPSSLKAILDKTKEIKQSPKWHSEGDVYIHTKLVTNRLHNSYRDVNLTLSGIFHDLGKIEATVWNEAKETWSAHGHEDYSTILVETYKEWINDNGGDVDTILYTVQSHMRIKFLEEFRIQEKMKFLSDPRFHYVQKFQSADYGGFGDECKYEMDLASIEKEIYNYQKMQTENKIISEKFNGRIIMEIYPTLKGKELGDFICAFKSMFDDFTSYALDASKEQITIDFRAFYLFYKKE